MSINKETGLTDKQERFCQEYIIDFNGTQAAIRAGYSEATARSTASEYLAKPNIQKRLGEIKKALSEKTELNQVWVLNRFKEISDRSMTAIPVMIFNPDTQQYEESGEYKYDSAGANKATENIGRIIGAYEKDNSQKVVQPPVINVLPPSK